MKKKNEDAYDTYDGENDDAALDKDEDTEWQDLDDDEDEEESEA